MASFLPRLAHLKMQVQFKYFFWSNGMVFLYSLVEIFKILSSEKFNVEIVHGRCLPLVFVYAGHSSKSKVGVIVGIVVPLFAVLLLGCFLLLFMWKGRIIGYRSEVFVDVPGLFRLSITICSQLANCYFSLHHFQHHQSLSLSFINLLRRLLGDVDQRIEFGQLKRFSWRELQLATDGFSEKNVLGQGGFGKVYEGVLADNTRVAVKRLMDFDSPGGETAFQREVEMISVAVHRNLLRLIGFCTTPTERLLVYPFMPNLSVASRLRGMILFSAFLWSFIFHPQTLVSIARFSAIFHWICN